MRTMRVDAIKVPPAKPSPPLPSLVQTPASPAGSQGQVRESQGPQISLPRTLDGSPAEWESLPGTPSK